MGIVPILTRLFEETTMKVTIDIPDMYVKTLAKWASVSRTLKAANHICEEYISITEDGIWKDRAFTVSDELDDLIPALDILHRTVRDELWKQLPSKK
jgi:hypothetical protein